MKNEKGFLGVDWHTFSTMLIFIGIGNYFGLEAFNDIQNPAGVSVGTFVAELAITLGSVVYLAQKSPKLLN